MNRSLICLLVVLHNVVAIAQPANVKIFYNGTIYTGRSSSITVAAVAISNDKILAAGSLQDVQKAAGSAAERVDLKGAFMMPGLIDSHSHVISGGRSLLVANLGDTLLSIDALGEYAKRSIANGRGLRGDVLYIQGLHSATWNEIQSLSILFNGPAFTGRSVFLRGSDGHTAWANAALLERAHIDASFIKTLSESELAFFGITNGVADGRLSEDAIAYITKVIPTSSISPLDALMAGVRHLNALGITAWMDPATGSTSDGISNTSLEAYEQAFQKGMLTARVTSIIVAEGNAEPQPQIKVVKEWQQRLTSTGIKVAGFKIFSDGVMEYPTQTASMINAYKNSGKHGSQMVDPLKFQKFLVAADRENLLVHIHAIGDKAVTESLDAVAAARKANNNSRLPHSITHLQCVQPSDFGRFKTLNVLASMQLLWATADNYTEELVKPYIDATAYHYMYPAHSIMANGGTICGASDWPVSSANPFQAMSVAEARGGTDGILNASEIMNRVDMLQSYTLHAARAILRDHEIGSIEAGKQADLIVVDRDVLRVSSDAIRDTKVLWTMVNGNIVYKR